MDDLSRYKRLFISPHPDDIAFSCYASLTNAPSTPRDALILTVFNQSQFSYRNDKRYPAKEVTSWRQGEDVAFATSLGCGLKFLNLPDSSLRHIEYSSEYQILTRDDPMFDVVTESLESIVNSFRGRSPIFLPLALGDHLDHRIVRDAVREILGRDGVVHDSNLLLYYEDLPYAASLSDHAISRHAGQLMPKAALPLLIDIDARWNEKLDGLHFYPSQLETSTISTLLKHAKHVGGGSRRAERLWIDKVDSIIPLVSTFAWVGWEAARILGGHSTVLSNIVSDTAFRSAVSRTLLIGPLSMPIDCLGYDPYEDAFSIAASLNSDIIYRTGCSQQAFQRDLDNPLFKAFRKIESLHDVDVVYLRDCRVDSHVVERLLIDFKDNVSLRKIHSPSLSDFLDQLREAFDLPLDCGRVHSLRTSTPEDSLTRHKALKDLVDSDPSQYHHQDNDSLYGLLLAQPAAECLFALLEPEESCSLIVQEPNSIPTAYAIHLLRKTYPPRKLKTIYFVDEIRPIANLVDGCVIPQGRFNAISAFHFEAPIGAIIEKTKDQDSRVPLQHLLDLDPLRHIHNHHNMRILQHSWKMDGALTVSDKVRDEVRFLDRGFVDKEINLFQPGVQTISCSAADKERCRQLLLSYAHVVWGFQVEPSNTLIALRITRAVCTKGLHRDLDLMYKCASFLDQKNKHILFLIVTSWSLTDQGSLPFISSVVKRASVLNEEIPNLHIHVINQYSWPKHPELGARPTGMSRNDLLRAADLSVALSTYDSYNISCLEPLSCGAIGVISTGCGAAKRISRLTGGEDTFVIADFTAELIESRERSSDSSESNGAVGHVNASSPQHFVSRKDLQSKSIVPGLVDGLSEDAEDTRDGKLEVSSVNTQLVESFFHITYDEKAAIEDTVIEKAAQDVIARLPYTEHERSARIKRGAALAAQMTWKDEIKKGLFPLLRKLFEG